MGEPRSLTGGLLFWLKFDFFLSTSRQRVTAFKYRCIAFSNSSFNSAQAHTTYSTSYGLSVLEKTQINNSYKRKRSCTWVAILRFRSAKQTGCEDLFLTSFWKLNETEGQILPHPHKTVVYLVHTVLYRFYFNVSHGFSEGTTDTF